MIFADIDCAMVHDVSGPGVIKVFEKLEKQGIDVSKLWDPDKIWVAEDHFVPSAEKTSAANVAKLEKFVKKYNISKHFKYGLGQYGICHTLSHEEGLVSPGHLRGRGFTYKHHWSIWGHLHAALDIRTWHTLC